MPCPVRRGDPACCLACVAGTALGVWVLPHYQHALALTQAGFIIIANGDTARGQQLLEQALPLSSKTANGWRCR